MILKSLLLEVLLLNEVGFYDIEIIETHHHHKVDAPSGMIELKETGFMSNRGRQNVASYFAKELLLDWRIGAAYFESLLIDYDVHSNYGNWMYVAGVGNDPRDRKFNTQLQAERYDGNHKYRKICGTKKAYSNDCTINFRRSTQRATFLVYRN